MKKIYSGICMMIVLIIAVTTDSFSQENEFSLEIEYSPNLSKMTDEFIPAEGKFSHNVLLRLQYNFKSAVVPTIGMGFLNVGEARRSDLRFPNMTTGEARTSYNYNYAIIPIGLRISMGKFYVLPEIGPGIYVFNRTYTTIKEPGAKTYHSSEEEILIQGKFNKLTFPVFLSVGRHFPIGKVSIFTGVKGYYSLNRIVENVPRDRKYYGVGLIVGVAF